MKTWQYFWQLMRYRPRYYATDLSAITVRFVLVTIGGLILRAFFNGLTGGDGFSLSVLPVVKLQLLEVLISIVVLYPASMAFVNFTQHGMALLVRNMVDRILQLPGASALPTDDDGTPMSAGKVISTLRDDASEMTQSIIIFDDTVALSVAAVVAFAIMFSINVTVTLGVFLPLAFVIYAAQRLGKLARRYRQASRQATSEVTAMIADMFNATQAIKVGHAEEKVIRRFREINARRRQTMVRDRLLTQLVDALSHGTVDIGVGLVLLLAAQAMISGDFTVGDFALFSSYIWPATHLMRTAGNLLTRYKQVGVSTQRMDNIMQGMPSGAVVQHNPIYMNEPYPVLETLVKQERDRLQRFTVRGLTYLHTPHQTDGEHADQVVSSGIVDVNLEVTRGSFTVITGRVGSGKTTLLKVLLGLLPAQRGERYWNGQLITSPHTFLIPPRVSYTGQVPHLFSETIRDNILLGLKADSGELQQAVELAILERDLEEMEAGLDTVVGPRGVRLSGGQIQRTAAARMFVRNAELLVFDDLSSALDVETERLLWERLFALDERPTCLVVSHRRAALRRADHIIVMEAGRIVDEGTLGELLEHSSEMQALWHGRAESES